MKHETVLTALLAAIIVWLIVFGFLLIESIQQKDREDVSRESTCTQAGFDHYYPNNGITTVQGKTYISCEREQIQDGVLNRTERWIPYNETKP